MALIENLVVVSQAGRKTMDPIMEEMLTKWIHKYNNENECMPSHSIIKKKAQTLSIFKDRFKASKGWYDKFMYRNFGVKFINSQIV